MPDIKIVNVVNFPADMSELELASNGFFGGKVLVVKFNEDGKSATVVYEQSVDGSAARSFNHGSYFSMGGKEQIIFPEIEYDKVLAVS